MWLVKLLAKENIENFGFKKQDKKLREIISIEKMNYLIFYLNDLFRFPNKSVGVRFKFASVSVSTSWKPISVSLARLKELLTKMNVRWLFSCRFLCFQSTNKLMDFILLDGISSMDLENFNRR